MNTALDMDSRNDMAVSTAKKSVCPFRQSLVEQCMAELPLDLQGLVVQPVRVEVFHDDESQAESTCGTDFADDPCFVEFQYVLTQLRSDDDEVFYEAPVYTEKLTSWRLADGRWFVWHTKIDQQRRDGAQTSVSFSDRSPR